MNFSTNTTPKMEISSLICYAEMDSGLQNPLRAKRPCATLIQPLCGVRTRAGANAFCGECTRCTALLRGKPSNEPAPPEAIMPATLSAALKDAL